MRLFSFFEIETSTLCNLRCPACPVSTAPRQEHFLDETLFTKAVRELADLGFTGVFSPHFYNEPLADPRLPRLLELANTINPAMRIILFTNATLLTPDLFAQLVASGVREFVVTIDNPVIAKACARLLAELSPAERELVRTRSITGSALSNRGGALTGLHGLSQPKTCLIPREYFVVNALGQALFCYNDYRCEHGLGNIAEQSLAEIWQDPENERLRAQCGLGRYELPFCRACRLSQNEEEQP